MNLRFHNDEIAAQSPRNFAGFNSGERNFATWHRNAEPGKNGFGLILVDFQRLDLSS